MPLYVSLKKGNVGGIAIPCEAAEEVCGNLESLANSPNE